MGDLILEGDCARSSALRHEVPVAIGDPFLLVQSEGRLHLLTNALERERMAKARPDAVLTDIDELGRRELQEQGRF
jgi:Xaa-Pro aminopeptidase